MLRVTFVMFIVLSSFINCNNVDAGDYRIKGQRFDHPWLNHSTYEFEVENVWTPSPTSMWTPPKAPEFSLPDFYAREREKAEIKLIEAQTEWYRYQLRQAKEAQRQAERDRRLATLTENHQQSETRTPTKKRVSKPGQSPFAKGKALVKRVLGKDKKEPTQKQSPSNKRIRGWSIPQLKRAFMSRLDYSHAETNKAAFAIYQYCDKPGIALDTAVVMYFTQNKGYSNKRAARALRILAH